MVENIILKEMKKAFKKNEVPISAVIVCKNKIISKAHNNKNIKNNVLGHAEIIAILKATKKLKTWNLSNCILYVTTEPCDMCKEIIAESRIKEVCYYLDKNKVINKKIIFQKIESHKKEEMLFILKSFFKSMRNSK